MGRIVRLNISLDNSHSLDDFPVDLYSGLTSGDTTNLVYANIVSEDIPLDLMFEDSDLNISNDPNNPFVPHCYMRISSDGCYLHDSLILPVNRRLMMVWSGQFSVCVVKLTHYIMISMVGKVQ